MSQCGTTLWSLDQRLTSGEGLFPAISLYCIMAVDSKATFRRGDLQVGLLPEDLAVTDGLGWNTYGTGAGL